MNTATAKLGGSKQGRMGRKRTRKPSKAENLSAYERAFASKLGRLIGDKAGSVAESVGVSHDAVLKWCAGESLPSLAKWPKIAAAIGLENPRDLLP